MGQGTRARRSISIGAAFVFEVATLASFGIHADPPSITSTSGVGDLGTAIIEAGTLHTITGGTRPNGGANLFHSFGRFNVGDGHTADFVNDAGLVTDNIVSRVTGGVRSDIQGTIKTTDFPGANLYLLNPAGVIFGPNASLDVSGSFHASTADVLKLGSDGEFYADPSNASTLSTESPSAFGFLGENPAGITIDGAYLRVPTHQNISLVGGDVQIDSGGTYSLRAARGTISIASVASSGVWKPDTPDLGTGSFKKLGKVDIRNKARISTSGGTAGKVIIRGGRFELNDSSLYSNTSTSHATHVGIDIAVEEDAVIRNGSQILANASTNVDGADIQIRAGNRVEVDGSNIQTASSQTSLAGRGGDVRISGKTVIARNGASIQAVAVHGPGGDLGITAENLEVRNGAIVRTSTIGLGDSGMLAVEAEQNVLLTKKNEAGVACNCSTGIRSRGAFGDGGPVTVKAKQMEVRDGAAISVSSRRSGRGGSIEVTAGKMTIEGLGPAGSRAGLYSQSNDSRATGDAGDVTVKADVLEVQDGGQITVAALGPGDGGNLSIEAKTIEVSGVAAGKSARLNADTEAEGQGGTIHIRTEGLNLTDGGQILASAFKTGDSGSVEIDGQPVSVLIEANDILIEGVSEGRSARIVAGTAGPGRAGDVIIRTNTLVARDGGDVSAFAESDGTAGTIEVTAESILLDGGDYPLLSTGFRAGAFANGQAGTLKITTGSLEVHNGAIISSSSWGDNAAGAIEVSADHILISAAEVQAESTATGLAAAAEGDGAGGTIRIRPRDNGLILDIRDGGSIQSGVKGSGPGGDIEVQAEQVLIGGVGPFGLPGYVFAGTTASGKGGNIDVRARTVKLEDQGVITTATWGAGYGGDTLVTADLLQMSGEASISADSHDSGDGGSIVILGEDVVLSGDALISATSTGTGDAGNINIIAGGDLRSYHSGITTHADIAKGGNIKLSVDDVIYLMNSEITASVGGGSGDGGNVNIDPVFVVLNHSSITANAVAGNGGAINIVTDFYIESPDSTLSASSETGIDGRVEVNTGETDVGGSVVALKGSFLDASNLLKGHCSAARAGSNGSSLVVGGGGGMPTMPDTYLPSFSFDDAEPAGSGSTALSGDSQLFIESAKRITDQALIGSFKCS